MAQVARRAQGVEQHFVGGMPGQERIELIENEGERAAKTPRHAFQEIGKEDGELLIIQAHQLGRVQGAHDFLDEIVRRGDGAAIHDDDALQGALVLALLRDGAQSALNLAQERGFADAADAHDREVAGAALQNAPQIQLTAKEAGAADRLARFIGRQQGQGHLRAEAVEQFTGGAPGCMNSVLVALIEHQGGKQGALQRRAQPRAVALDQDNGVALGQVAQANQLGQALGQLALGQRGQVTAGHPDDR